MFKSKAPASVAEVMSSFTAAIDQLKSVKEVNQSRCESAKAVIAAEEKRLADAESEAKKAEALSEKLQEFISVE